VGGKVQGVVGASINYLSIDINASRKSSKERTATFDANSVNHDTDSHGQIPLDSTVLGVCLHGVCIGGPCRILE